MPIQVKGLDALKNTLSRLRKAVRVPGVFVDLPDTEEQKIEWIVKGNPEGNKAPPRAPRDILKLTPKLSADMAAAFAKAFARVLIGGDPDKPWQAAGEVYLKYIQDRIAFSGGDLHSKLDALRPSTIKRKGHNRLFYDTGDLLKAIMAAKVQIRR